MAFQPAPNIAQIQVVGRVDGQVTINNLYFEVSGGGITAVNLEAITIAVQNWAVSQLAPELSEDWSFERAIGVDLTLVDGARVEVANPTPGGIAGEAAPNNVACCVSFRTSARGRSYRGRNYIPGIPNTVIDLNAMDPAFLSSISGTYSLMIGAGTFEAGWQWVVLSRQTGGVPRANGIGSPVTSVTFSTPYVRSMRSRSVGRGA